MRTPDQMKSNPRINSSSPNRTTNNKKVARQKPTVCRAISFHSVLGLLRFNLRCFGPLRSQVSKVSRESKARQPDSCFRWLQTRVDIAKLSIVRRFVANWEDLAWLSFVDRSLLKVRQHKKVTPRKLTP